MGGTVRIGIQQKETKLRRQKAEIRGQQAGVCFFVAFCSALLAIAGRQKMTEEVAAEEEDDAGCPA